MGPIMPADFSGFFSEDVLVSTHFSILGSMYEIILTRHKTQINITLTSLCDEEPIKEDRTPYREKRYLHRYALFFLFLSVNIL